MTRRVCPRSVLVSTGSTRLRDRAAAVECPAHDSCPCTPQRLHERPGRGTQRPTARRPPARTRGTPVRPPRWVSSASSVICRPTSNASTTAPGRSPSTNRACVAGDTPARLRCRHPRSVLVIRMTGGPGLQPRSFNATRSTCRADDVPRARPHHQDRRACSCHLSRSDCCPTGRVPLATDQAPAGARAGHQRVLCQLCLRTRSRGALPPAWRLCAGGVTMGTNSRPTPKPTWPSTSPTTRVCSQLRHRPGREERRGRRRRPT